MVVAVQRQLVEGLTGRLHSHNRAHRFQPQLLQCKRIHKRLRGGLHGELDICIACPIDVACGGAHRRAQVVRVCNRKLWDIVRYFSALIITDMVEDFP